MGIWGKIFSHDNENLRQVVEDFRAATSQEKARQILEKHPELLSDEADSFLGDMSNATANVMMKDRIQGCRSFLRRCRILGVAHSFDEINRYSNESKDDLAAILSEIDQLTKSQDLPKRIFLLNKILQIVSRHDNAELWAAIQAELGVSLARNPLGNRAENIEQAIIYLQNSLQVRTFQDFPEQWAMTQNNLGNAYSDRIRGNRGENIEHGIKHYQNVLEFCTYQGFPVQWGIAQNNLGNAYLKRIQGDELENIENAIKHYENALKVRTRQEFPENWALTQNNLAGAYLTRARIRCDSVGDIEKAIKHLENALQVFTQWEYPEKWAMTQTNMSDAYCHFDRGYHADNIEKAIKHSKNALQVYTQSEFPEMWATTQNSLGILYYWRFQGSNAKDIEKSREENIEKAIEHYTKALQVYTLQDYPEGWATTQENLAGAYLPRQLGDKARNIEQAIQHYQNALKIFTCSNFPKKWANIQNHLGEAYCKRINNGKPENIKEAILHYNQALTVFELSSFTREYRQTNKNLGDLYLDEGQLEESRAHYNAAIEADNILYNSQSSAKSKDAYAKWNSSIYKYASLVACRMRLGWESILILEQGKTRLLRETFELEIKRRNNVPLDVWDQYGRAAAEYCNVATHDGIRESNARQHVVSQEAFEKLYDEIKGAEKHAPSFQNEIEISEIMALLDEETALLAFCITDKGSAGFVINTHDGVNLVNIPGFKSENLNSLLISPDKITGAWLDAYWIYVEASRRYQYAYATYFDECNPVEKAKAQERLLEINRRLNDVFRAWLKTIDNVLSQIGTKLLAPLLSELPPQTRRIVLLPASGLFLLPLHAVPLSNGQFLGQRYCISYAPSIQLLKEMRIKAKTMKGDGLYGVINPQEDPTLIFSEYEGRAISRFFPSKQMEIGHNATRATVLDGIPGRAYLHFSCHGIYNWEDPSKSGLFLNGGRTLSLADLRNGEVDLSSARLVTLSACETGITDIIKGSPEEFVGLPAGFMLAGVPCVVSSLWSVPDISTALLMERFYSNHIGGMDIPMALQKAQLWVRDLTASQVTEHIERCYRSGKWEDKSKEFIEMYRERYLEMANGSSDKKPFQHPYYWAAFTVNGA